jgi:hypothetical protein
MRRLPVFALMLAAAPAAGETLATLYSHNGTVAPPYHRNLAVEIDGDGTVRLRACRGYGKADGDCRDGTAAATPAALAAILAAARDAGLPGRPIAEDRSPPVGGSATSGSVRIDGTVARLPAFPAAADLDRCAEVLAAILAAVPPEAVEAVQRAVDG